ncbi:unnamed protein product [Boreogadus saida]
MATENNNPDFCVYFLAELGSTDLCNDDFADHHHHHPQGYTVGGTNAENKIRRMLSATMANRVACIFNWAGKGPKRTFKDTLMQDSAAHKFDRKLTELQYRGALQKWLRYAPEEWREWLPTPRLLE